MLAGFLQRRGGLEENAVLRAQAVAHHDGDRRRQTQRARAADDQHRDAARQREADRLCRSSSHTAVVTTAMAMTVGTNTPDTLSATFAIGALVAAASLTIWMIWESVVSSPTRVASQRRKPDWLTVAAETLSPTALSTGMLSPVSADSLTALFAFEHHAVHRDALARTHDEDVAALHLLDRHRRLPAPLRSSRRGLRARASSGS